MNRLLFAVLVAVVIAGCESGNSIAVDVSVSQALATSFTQNSPGVLRVSSATKGVQSVAALCGSALDDQHVKQDLGFGCLSDVGRSLEDLQAWIEPLPDGWNTSAFCALTAQSGELDVSSAAPASPAGGTGDGLATDPASSWHQAESTVEWVRDGSSLCGGIARGSLSLE
jgi:hypothetical protein